MADVECSSSCQALACSLRVAMQHKRGSQDEQCRPAMAAWSAFRQIETTERWIALWENNSANHDKLQENLPEERFIRVHKSYIVALEKIESIERGRISLKDKLIPIGDTYKDAFYNRIGEKHH